MSQISLELQHQISQFLYREAKLLDDWKFRDWLDVLAEDISYTLRTTPNAQTRDRRRSIEPPTTWVFNDTKDLLERRVARLETGMAWAEEPPSRTTHMVSNMIVEATEVEGEYDVYVTYLLYRTQKEKMSPSTVVSVTTRSAKSILLKVSRSSTVRLPLIR